MTKCMATCREVRRAAVFPDVNPLHQVPSARRPLCSGKSAQVHRCEREVWICAGHVVIALGSVNEKRVAIANQPRKEAFQIYGGRPDRHFPGISSEAGGVPQV